MGRVEETANLGPERGSTVARNDRGVVQAPG